MTDRPYNAANRKDVRVAEKALIEFATIEREVICGIMSIPNGRWWMYEMLGRSQTYADPFVPDPYSHAYLAGRKAQGTELHAAIMAYAPDTYAQMIREHHERSATYTARRTNAGPEPDPFAEPESESDAAA